MDQIKIENLKVFAYHGVYESEREKGQNFFVNATLYTDLTDASREDDVEYTTDYASVCQTIKDEMTLKTYSLIETAAERVAQSILVNFPKIDAVDIEVKKPQAPVPSSLCFQRTSYTYGRDHRQRYFLHHRPLRRGFP